LVLPELRVGGAAQYIAALADDADIGAAVITAIGSGLRRGELLALRWCDVDLDAGTVRVTRALERAVIHDPSEPKKIVAVKLNFKEPKTTTSRRTVPLPAFAVQRLRRHHIIGNG
jgi:integrase